MKIRSFNTQTSCCSVGMLLKRNLKTPPRSSFGILRPPIFRPKKLKAPQFLLHHPLQLKLRLVPNVVAFPKFFTRQKERSCVKIQHIYNQQREVQRLLQSWTPRSRFFIFWLIRSLFWRPNVYNWQDLRPRFFCS